MTRRYKWFIIIYVNVFRIRKKQEKKVSPFGPMIEFILKLGCWILEGVALLLLPGIIICSVFALVKSKKRKVIVTALTLVIFVSCLVFVYHKPFLLCPREYQTHISEETRKEIKAGGSGFYSDSIPFLAVAHEIVYADSEECIVRTWYYPIGTSEKRFSAFDAPECVRSIHF